MIYLIYLASEKLKELSLHVGLNISNMVKIGFLIGRIAGYFICTKLRSYSSGLTAWQDAVGMACIVLPFFNGRGFLSRNVYVLDTLNPVLPFSVRRFITSAALYLLLLPLLQPLLYLLLYSCFALILPVDT